MTETMPKGWNDLSPLAKSGYVDAVFVEEVDNAISEASKEIVDKMDETKGMNAQEYGRYCLKVMRKHVDAV